MSWMGTCISKLCLGWMKGNYIVLTTTERCSKKIENWDVRANQTFIGFTLQRCYTVHAKCLWLFTRWHWHFLLPFGRRIGVIFISPKMTKSVCLKIPSPRLSENIPVHITLNFEDKFSSEAQSHNFNFHWLAVMKRFLNVLLHSGEHIAHCHFCVQGARMGKFQYSGEGVS